MPGNALRAAGAAERRCRKCGCTELHACPGGCWWVGPDLCSACAGVDDRDPRLDPRAGDVLAVRSDVRCVLDRDDYRITYTFPHKSAERSIPLVVWQAWARAAEVRESAT